MEDIINNQAMNQAQQAIDASYASLVGARKQIPEHVFKHFLPFFTGQRLISEVPDVLTKWIAIAGAPNAPVDVYDKAKRILFTVPGVMNTLSADSALKRGNLDMSRIIEDYELHASRTPASGQRYLNQAIDQKLATVSANTATGDWQAVFSYYGIKNAQISPSAVNSTDEAVLDYE